MATDVAPVATDVAPTLDERFVVDSPDVVKRALEMRRASADQLGAVDRIGELTAQRAEAVNSGNDARAERKSLSPKIGALLKKGEQAEAEALKVQVAACSKASDEADARVEALEAERKTLFDSLPNLLDPRTPEGDDEEANLEVDSWGCEGELRSDLKWHDELGTELGVLDVEAGAKLSGSRFSVLRGSLARLERALINFFVDMHTDKHGYTEVMVPYLVGAQALYGTGQLPKFEEDLFKLKVATTPEALPSSAAGPMPPDAFRVLLDAEPAQPSAADAMLLSIAFPVPSPPPPPPIVVGAAEWTAGLPDPHRRGAHHKSALRCDA